jgi:hypothetical protein
VAPRSNIATSGHLRHRPRGESGLLLPGVQLRERSAAGAVSAETPDDEGDDRRREDDDYDVPAECPSPPGYGTRPRRSPGAAR